MILDKNIIDKRTINFFKNLEVKLNILHNGKYDYSETIYKRKRDSITYKCKAHGYITQNAGEHIRGRGCRLCAVKLRKDQTRLKYEKTLIEDFKKIHGEKYTYEKVKYITGSKKVEINCKIHGVFMQRPDDHKSGYGCIYCAREHNGFRKSRLKNKKTILYHIIINDILHKVGISTTSIKDRYRREKNISYKIINEYIFEDGEIAYEKELEILRFTKDYKYIGQDILKGGNTELRTIDLTEIVKNIVNKENNVYYQKH